jgi:hypothetical protein
MGVKLIIMREVKWTLSSHAPTPPGDQGSGTANAAPAATAIECSTWNNRTKQHQKQGGLCVFDPSTGEVIRHSTQPTFWSNGIELNNPTDPARWN